VTTMKPLELEAYMQTHIEWIEEYLNKLIPDGWHVPDILREAMQYSISAGGKRLRPILTLAAAESIGKEGKLALPAACAIEMIHTYSLIHDDLPAMDDDDYRRGQPTNHRVFGEAMAILAGDGLLTHAFYIAAELGRTGEVSPEHVLQIIRELSEYAGPRGMVGGQTADILGEQGLTTLAELEYIHQHKTSDLIICSLRTGALAAMASSEQLEALTRFGACIGLAFQIQDDVLDLIGDEQKLGKKTRSDEKEHKVTYPYLLGLDACIAKVAELTSEGKNALLAGDIPHPAQLLGIADYLMKRDH
jgi:geranylgeranyl diphosphate synthase type II